MGWLLQLGEQQIWMQRRRSWPLEKKDSKPWGRWSACQLGVDRTESKEFGLGGVILPTMSSGTYLHKTREVYVNC